MKNTIHRNPLHRRRQKGAITMFSAVLILILLTSMILYALQVGVFEQRKSANEMMQKMSFHTADSGIQSAKQFMSANANSAVDEWLTAGTELRWQECGTMTGSGTHPCFGEPVQGLRNGSYFYSFDKDSYPGGACAPANDNELPVCWGGLGANATENVTLHALLCMLEIDRNLDPIVQGCTTEPSEQDSRYFLITLMARGEADCDVNGNCGSETLITEKIGSFGPGGGDGGPGAPLTARTNVPLSGTVEIVPNPNGGGVGVPISSWVNTNPACSDPNPISPISGSYATCERQEWYGQDTVPTDFACPTTNCSCDKTKEKMITYASGNDREMGIDIVIDPLFPCDLFEETFGMTAKEAKKLAASVPGHLLDDCSSLDSDSEGFYWVSGSSCVLKDQIGSKDNVVFLVSAAGNTSVSAGAELFGVLMVTDEEDPDADFTGNGHATIYGAAIMDAEMEHFNGTFQIVYVEKLIGQAYDSPLFGAVAGGWTDFHAAWQ